MNKNHISIFFLCIAVAAAPLRGQLTQAAPVESSPFSGVTVHPANALGIQNSALPQALPLQVNTTGVAPHAFSEPGTLGDFQAKTTPFTTNPTSTDAPISISFTEVVLPPASAIKSADDASESSPSVAKQANTMPPYWAEIAVSGLLIAIGALLIAAWRQASTPSWNRRSA